jgi:protease PrsW
MTAGNSARDNSPGDRSARQNIARRNIARGNSIRAVRLTAVVLCIFGAAVVGWHYYRFLLVFPGPAALGVVFELPLLLIGFWLLRLLHPVRAPPLRWSWAAVVWGATAAVGCALLANQGLIALWAKGAGVRFASDWSASLSAPLNEEIFKACGVLMIVLAAPTVIQGPLDGMVFGAITGLGFQVIENIIYGLNNILQSGAIDPVQAITSSLLIRVGQAALGSHWTMTAVAGAGIGYLIWHARGRSGLLPGLACLAGAMAMHVLFDAPQPSVPVKVIINLIIVTALYVLVSNSYLARARQAIATGTFTALSPAQASTTLSRRQRRHELRQVPAGAERDRVLARQQEILARIDAEAA